MPTSLPSRITDLLRVKGMIFQARHGCTPAEREVGATFRVDAELFFDQVRAADSDRLEDTVDVARVYEIVREVVAGNQYNLIETVAAEIARSLLEVLTVDSVRVRVHKLRSPLPGLTDGYEVEIYRP